MKAEIIECPLKDTIWDLSGIDKSGVVLQRAASGSNSNVNGNDGTIGDAGGPGGNVTFIAQKYVGLQNMTVISHGGEGMRGQDGGHGLTGKNGVDGTALNRQEMVR